MITIRSLHKDIARYNQETADEAAEEFGWKLVHGDVFRPPKAGMLLAVLCGTGCQIIIMTFITLLFACFGFLSPANRGALGTCTVVVFILCKYFFSMFRFSAKKFGFCNPFFLTLFLFFL